MELRNEILTLHFVRTLFHDTKYNLFINFMLGSLISPTKEEPTSNLILQWQQAVRVRRQSPSNVKIQLPIAMPCCLFLGLQF